jgi:DNA-binding response OmpR family regulator
VVDDAPDVQLIARMALEKNFEVLEAGSLRQAQDLLKTEPLDLLILDLALPDGDGLEFCRKLHSRGAGHAPPVILLTGKGGIGDKLDGFSAGAEDYVVKPFDASELLARSLLRTRRRVLPVAAAAGEAGSDLLRIGDLEFETRTSQVAIRTRGGLTAVELTKREFRLLLFLARAGGRILSRDQLIKHVWDTGAQITGRTVDAHICKLRKKLQLSRFTIHSVYGAGYRFVEPVES